MFRSFPATTPFLLLAIRIATANANPNLPLDRPFTLKNTEPFGFELENDRQIRSGGPRSYTFPRACRSEADSALECNDIAKLGYLDSLGDKSLFLSPIAGIEYRYLRENVAAMEAGIWTWGNSGPLSFRLDARMTTEMHENSLHPSYDHEYVERQDEGDSHGVEYSSYSRYRSDLSYDWDWGRLTVARDAAHWGPGLYGNLVFNRNSVPFNQVVFTTHLGPLSVTSLYGQLSISGPGEFPEDGAGRSVYAHRYEFSPSARWTFGISEQMILYGREAPFAFIPIVPLYIAKAYSSESRNNGNIAVDVSYAIPGFASLYSEFLVDDLKSPSGLFDDLWANKWAWLAGLHYVGNVGSGQTGLILEYSRVEPWVYTHYFPGTAQSANQGVPLGNPLGPNSMNVRGKAYAVVGRFRFSVESEVVWKGRDNGSNLADTIHEHSYARKHFLADAEPAFSAGPSAAFIGNRGRYVISLEARSTSRVLVAVRYRY